MGRLQYCQNAKKFDVVNYSRLELVRPIVTRARDNYNNGNTQKFVRDIIEIKKGIEFVSNDGVTVANIHIGDEADNYPLTEYLLTLAASRGSQKFDNTIMDRLILIPV